MNSTIESNTIWCPYTDKDVTPEETTREHIIPLSLGGCNSFCIPVDKTFNSKTAAKVDADVADDFFVKFRRREFHAIGHSKKQPIIEWPNSKFEDDKEPIHITLKGKEPPLIFAHKTKKVLDEKDYLGKTFISELNLNCFAYIKFTAKVALSAGYNIYGDLFRKNVSHHELRLLMNYSNKKSENPFSSGKLRVYDRYCEIKEEDKVECDTHKFMCSAVKGSCVLIIPCSQNVIFVVGILGEWIATINIAADTKDFPIDDEHDLGHVVILANKEKYELSYREFAKSMLPILASINKSKI